MTEFSIRCWADADQPGLPLSCLKLVNRTTRNVVVSEISSSEADDADDPPSDTCAQMAATEPLRVLLIVAVGTVLDAEVTTGDDELSVASTSGALLMVAGLPAAEAPVDPQPTTAAATKAAQATELIGGVKSAPEDRRKDRICVRSRCGNDSFRFSLCSGSD